jgi:elongation of very long chain fatty acids protein 6
MEVLDSVYQNPILREYFNPNQFHVTSWVRDPNGFEHPFVFDFEKKFFDKTYSHNIYNWMNKWWWLSIVYSIIYVGLIYFGRSLMENRERFELRLPLILWNTSLALFSIFGMIRCLPEMIYNLNTSGLQYSICDNSNIFGVTGFWYVEFYF